MVWASVWEADGAPSTVLPVTTEFIRDHDKESGGTMTKSSRQLDLVRLRYIHEILFSCSIAFLAVSLISLVAPSLLIPFIHLEVSINRFLSIRQTDFIRGYLEYFISSVTLAFCIALFLQISSGTRLTKEILRSGSGVMLLLAPPVFWFCYYQLVGWPFGWPYRWSLVELAVAVF